MRETALYIFEILFDGKMQVSIDNRTYPIETYSSSGEKYITVLNYQFVEQNRLKNSHWAEKARSGHKIMWALKDWKCIGMVRNGEFSLF